MEVNIEAIKNCSFEKLIQIKSVIEQRLIKKPIGEYNPQNAKEYGEWRCFHSLLINIVQELEERIKNEFFK